MNIVGVKGSIKEINTVADAFRRRFGVIVYVFDSSNIRTVSSIPNKWFGLEEQAGLAKKRLVVGNKFDLIGEGNFDLKIADGLRESLNADGFLHTSAYNGYLVNELFGYIANLC